MSGSIQMDNNYIPEHEAGFWQWLFGRSVTSIVLCNLGPEDGFVGIAAPSPARILPIDLANFGGEILCQPDAFLCSVNDVRAISNVDQRPRNFEVGAEVKSPFRSCICSLVFFLSLLVVQKILAPGEVLIVDAVCIVAMTCTINFQLKHSHPMRRVVFGLPPPSRDRSIAFSIATAVIATAATLQRFLHHSGFLVHRAVAAPSLRDNPKFFMQIALLFFLAYVMIVSSLILTDV
ncbi:hypothetical protein B296_00008902 [Ensete ventricosum]|uniref:Uncharacterized protein n=1 Tax=Ensete ventricosum TaxID=4639 RepID=A0A427A654_ENSVE|nr:hypothetical protein B296_00008902 [Ensete ventricosum]